MLSHVPIVKTVPLEFKKGSTLVMVVVNGKDTCCFVGEDARMQALYAAREAERDIYDQEDKKRKALGRPKVARPNV